MTPLSPVNPLSNALAHSVVAPRVSPTTPEIFGNASLKDLLVAVPAEIIAETAAACALTYGAWSMFG